MSRTMSVLVTTNWSPPLGADWDIMVASYQSDTVARCPLYPQKRTFAVHKRMSALGQKRTFPSDLRRCRKALSSRPELVIAALRTARTVVEVRPLVTAVYYRSESVETVHDRLHKDQGIVRRAEGGLQVPNGLDDERSCRGIATEYLRKIGIGPVGDVIVPLIFPEVAAFDRISAVVDQEDHRLVVVP